MSTEKKHLISYRDNYIGSRRYTIEGLKYTNHCEIKRKQEHEFYNKNAIKAVPPQHIPAKGRTLKATGHHIVVEKDTPHLLLRAVFGRKSLSHLKNINKDKYLDVIKSAIEIARKYNQDVIDTAVELLLKMEEEEGITSVNEGTER